MSKQNKNNPTIYDVASKAGVSITTVSRFLNNSDNVKESTSLRIAKAIEDLDYISQGNAGRRTTRQVGRIGVLTPFFPAPSFVQRLEGMAPIFRENNYEMIIYTIEGADQLSEYLTSVPFTRRIDGLILMSVHLTPEQNRILKASGLQVVIVESDEKDFSRVLADDYQGGQMAARYFLKKKYLPCVYMGDQNNGLPYSLHPSDIRFNGFSDTLQAAEKPIKWMNLISNATVEDAEKTMGEYLDAGNHPRGVFAMSDLLAIGILKAARKRNIKVPEEMAILGFDNIKAADWMGISTISQHLDNSGRVAAKLLIEQITQSNKTIQKISIQLDLVERTTT